MENLVEEFNQLQCDLSTDPEFCRRSPNENGFHDGDCPITDCS